MRSDRDGQPLRDVVHIAGGFLAWSEVHYPTMAPPRHTIVVSDRLAQREAYTVDVTAYMAGQPSNVRANFDLQDDGTIVVASPEFRADPNAPARVAWASVAEPLLHELPVAAGSLQLSLHDGLVALRRADRGDYAVIGLDGSDRNVFEYKGAGQPFYPRVSGIDFDGTRLTWFQGDAIHNEAYPVVATPDVPTGTVPVDSDGVASVPVWCPDPRAKCIGSVTVAKGRASTLS